MADTAKIDYTVSMTPITTLEANADQNVATDVINIDIGKGLSGRADVTVDTAGHTTVGYAAGVVSYLNAIDSGKTQIAANDTAYDFVFIKHTGKDFSTTTVLGPTIISVGLDVFIEYTAGSAWAKICSIPPGGAICLPNFPSQGADKGIFVQPASGTDHIAVEYALIT